jgi:UDP-N-acetylmuramoyl-tripeptide--D-alanyl-D-alanine ligase
MPFFMENLEEIYAHYLKSAGVFTDTRKPLKNGLFFALKGPHFDGNEYVATALKGGASKAIVSSAKWADHPDCIFQEDTLTTLQNLACWHRKHFEGTVIAITGSNGKTTTKELFKALLSTDGPTFATHGNLNNHIGVPLSLLSMPVNAKYYIVEMGANHIGEIAALCAIAQPDWGYITNFGSAHLEGFGSKEGVIQGKTELYQYLIQNDKNILYNALDPIQTQMAKPYAKSVSFGGDEADINLKSENTKGAVKIKHEATLFSSALYGDYNAPNIAAALAFGLHQKIHPKDLQKGLDTYVSGENRSQKIKTASNELLLDAYNANPNSMQAALNAFAGQPQQNKVVILGAMMELGPYSAEAHQELVKKAVKFNFEKIVLVGAAFEQLEALPKNALHFSTTAACKKWLIAEPLTNKFILLKGSRSMALETLQEVL